ncbi:ribonuclease M5 [Apilactobacillus xinyiensis]|uniref:ribonuclease M5 n=1 Tax=Apilactobacillus xinyiensis TaxID=2841032 RepID=UPI00200C4D24|nr:ribonuclease M5 [Apilactobacillus xinyiensis]MCL0330453.1 ribonuclease M5 [Apilactobacillus xinyiensis]
MKKIEEVIVVEGRDDTKRIKMAVNADTIETRGSAVSDETIKLIQKIAKTRGIIIFTDPDFSGERIRRIVSQAVPNAKHAFVARNKSVPTKSDGSLGVEHASVETIRESLSNLYTENTQADEQINRDDLMAARLINDVQAKVRREKLCSILQIGYVNAKQLSKRLRMFGISKHEFNTAIKSIDKKGI